MNSNIKPLSTTTPEAIAAANQVTPERLSNLLLEKGPLAIRYITKELSLSIPCFKDLSTSKQRRLIMSAMETGDVKNNRLFEKIGWGQWSIKVVPSEDFESQRKYINLHNLEVKLLHQSSGGPVTTTTTTRKRTMENASSVVSIPKETSSYPDKIIYIDENAIHSDVDENDDDEDENDHSSEKNITIDPQSTHNKIIKATVHYPRKRLHSFSTSERPTLIDQSTKRIRRGSAVVYSNHEEFNSNNFATEPDKSPRLSFILQQPVTVPITPRKLSYSSSTSVESSIRSTLPSDDTTIATNDAIATNITATHDAIATYHLNNTSPPLHINKSESVSPYSDTDDEDWSILSPLNHKRQQQHHSMSNEHDLHLIDELTAKGFLNGKMYTFTPNKFDDDSSIPRSMSKTDPLIKDQYKDNDVVSLLLNLRS